MRRLSISLLFLAAAIHPAPAGEEKSADADSTSSRALIRELNLARQNPALYATFVEELRGRMNGNIMVLPGRTRIRTKEGTRALDEAIRFLRSAQPQAPLALSPGMSRAAADHCADQAFGGFGHADVIQVMLTDASPATEPSAAAGAKISPTAKQPRAMSSSRS